jgi:tyrosyl-tRNA synthetase
MEEIKFKSITDLYRRLLPALNTKKNNINRTYKSNIMELDIWNYLKNNIWVSSKNLSLNDMVDDILNIDNEDVYNYYKERGN